MGASNNPLGKTELVANETMSQRNTLTVAGANPFEGRPGRQRHPVS